MTKAIRLPDTPYNKGLVFRCAGEKETTPFFSQSMRIPEMRMTGNEKIVHMTKKLNDEK